MDGDGDLLEALDAMQAAYDRVAALRVDAVSHTDLLTALSCIESLTRQLPSQTIRLTTRLQREASPVQLGAKSLAQVLTGRLRISAGDARRRLGEAEDLGPRVTFGGQALPPLLPKVAAAQAAGSIGGEHVRVLREFFTSLPGSVDADTRELAEGTLVRIASSSGPEEVRRAAARLMTAIDQDGPLPDDRERARRRFLHVGRQQSDGMTPLTGLLDPQARAILEVVTAKWAAPGMCNPDDDTPCATGTPSQVEIDGDTRSAGQRTHDAFIAIGRSVLSSGELGQHNGLPVTVIVSTTLQDLESARGSAVTGGGSLLPMSDLIRMASHAHHYLAVFDKHTSEALYLGRAKRIAPAGHRIVLHSRDRGCTFPGCTVSGYGCQVHHVNGWARNNGQTNVDEEVFACPGDNRLAEDGWTVVLRSGVAEWIPPPQLDTGQTRINYLHHPERLLMASEPDTG